MAGFLKHFILASLLCWLTVSAASGTLKKLTGALGGSVTFPLSCTVKQGDTFIWTFNAVSLVASQPAVEGKQATVIVTQTHNKERIVFTDGGCSLKLGPLKKDDTGVYRVEMHGESSKSPFIQEYALHVYEYLTKPRVTMGQQDNKNGTCVTNLTCSVDQAGDVSYSWKVVGRIANESHDGSILPVSWKLRERGMTFICIASNPISTNSSSPILAWKLCEGAANGLDSFMFFLTYLCVPILFILVVLASIRLIARTKKRKDTIDEMKKVGIHQEVPNSCPYVEESAVYDTIPCMNGSKETRKSPRLAENSKLRDQ
uniref:SLAM family member 7 n=1 Tax=Jaculus jaculus TaxID=51337 RepID=UPI001E1B22FA|nr:SLAM family member 7 [Jaculus jaculus]